MKSFSLIQTICFSTGIFINFNYKINDRRTRSNISGFHMHVLELALSNAIVKLFLFYRTGVTQKGFLFFLSVLFYNYLDLLFNLNRFPFAFSLVHCSQIFHFLSDTWIGVMKYTFGKNEDDLLPQVHVFINNDIS